MASFTQQVISRCGNSDMTGYVVVSPMSGVFDLAIYEPTGENTLYSPFLSAADDDPKTRMAIIDKW